MMIRDMNRDMTMLWGNSRGTPPDHKGTQPFTPYSGFTPGTLVLPTCTTASRQAKVLARTSMEVMQSRVRSTLNNF